MPSVTYTTNNHALSFWMSGMHEAESIAVAAAEHYCSNTSCPVSWPLSLSIHLDGKALGRFIVKHGPALVASQVFDLTSFEHGDLLPNCRCMTTAVESDDNYASQDECTVQRVGSRLMLVNERKGECVCSIDPGQSPEVTLRRILDYMNIAYRAGSKGQRRDVLKSLIDWANDES